MVEPVVSVNQCYLEDKLVVLNSICEQNKKKEENHLNDFEKKEGQSMKEKLKRYSVLVQHIFSLLPKNYTYLISIICAFGTIVTPCVLNNSIVCSVSTIFT